MTVKKAPASAAPKRPVTPAPAGPALPELAPGDIIRHKVFGQGTVTQITKMPGDALLTVDFAGTAKRLMLKAAGPFIKKL